MICPICRKPCLDIFVFCEAHLRLWRGSPEGMRIVSIPSSVAHGNSMLADFATRARAEGL
jgi:hypothetical protein